ncbi:MAG: hypothetical protein LBR10_00180 [Prevotellaceae bacterium]|jgi:hypothetical protein|nr:hypothetical protein [Prevotellaceae bacterium]
MMKEFVFLWLWIFTLCTAPMQAVASTKQQEHPASSKESELTPQQIEKLPVAKAFVFVGFLGAIALGTIAAWMFWKNSENLSHFFFSRRDFYQNSPYDIMREKIAWGISTFCIVAFGFGTLWVYLVKWVLNWEGEILKYLNT